MRILRIKLFDECLTLITGLAFCAFFWIGLSLPFEMTILNLPSNLTAVVDLLICAVLITHRVSLESNFIGQPRSTLIREGLSFLPLFAFCQIASETSAAFISAGPLQLLHLLYLPTIVENYRSENQLKLTPNSLKITVVIACGLLTIHTLACGWLWFYPPEDDHWTAYNKALYWVTTTLTTIGYGDITPTNNIGRVYTMGVQILGAAIYGIAIANASSMLTQRDRRSEERKSKLGHLHSFFKHYEVPEKVQKQTLEFYSHLLSRKVSDEENSVLNDLPQSLQHELKVFMNIKPISKVQIFQGCSFACLSDVANALQQAIHAPGDRIIQKGQIGHEMYLIGHGVVHVHIGDQFIAEIEQGHCFGEMALIFSEPRVADVTAQTYCDIFKLSQDQFHVLMERHPDLKANVQQIASRRAKRAAA